MSGRDIAGKVAVVTGAAAGIGKAISRQFVAHGMRVAAIDIDGEGLAELCDGHAADRMLAVQADIADPQACSRAVSETLGHFGALHCLVNNAAIGMNAVNSSYYTGQLEIDDVDEALWQSFIMTNACGHFYMARRTVPHMRSQSWGRIVNVGTSYFTMMRPGLAPYGPSKAVIEAYTAMLAGELAGSGITVNMVLPGGPTNTRMVPDEEDLDRSTLIRPDMMAPPMLGLFSEAASNVTGYRFRAVDWSDTIRDPARQERRPAGWPELATPLASLPAAGS